MCEIKIYKSKWKAIKLILLALPFIYLGIWDIIHNSRYGSPLVDWISVCFFGLGIPIGLFNLLDKRPELVLNETGLFDRSSYGIFEKKVDKGFVKWESITDAYLSEWQNSYRGIKTSKQKYICLILDKHSQAELKTTNPTSTKLSHALGLGDFIIPLINLKKFDEKKFIELIKLMSQISVDERHNLLLTTSI